MQQNQTIDHSKAFAPFQSEEITAIGHRVVHGGPHHAKSVWITDSILDEIEALSPLAPLHNPPSIEGIRFCRQTFQGVPQYAVFDTAFHRKMPVAARSYAIPHPLAAKYQIERYGFHGIAHAASSALVEKLRGPTKMISCHLGAGSSLAAIDSGRSLDTSMGFTPNEGVMMATRSGDVDPGLFEFLSRSENLSIQSLHQILNFESGLLGVSQISSSMRDLLKSDHPQAKAAVELFCYRVTKMIGAYLAVLKGCEAIVFSGGIGENASEVRKNILDSFKWIGFKLDIEKNVQAVNPHPSEIKEISTSDSQVKGYVIGSDENRYIAEQHEEL